MILQIYILRRAELYCNFYIVTIQMQKNKYLTVMTTVSSIRKVCGCKTKKYKMFAKCSGIK